MVVLINELARRSYTFMVNNYENLRSKLEIYAGNTPLAVGMPVWFLDKYHGRLEPTSVSELKIDSKGIEFRLARNASYFTHLSALGKTVFLCEEDALEVLNG